MYKSKSILGVITARSGSKGLPGKNIKSFCGKPLIYWTIKSALTSRYLDNVIVSTDSPEIAQISRKSGASVPFIRPKHLAKDNSSSIDVVLHALEFLRKQGEKYDLVMLLQPTSPLRMKCDIDDAIKLLFKRSAQAVVSVSPASHSLYWSNILPKSECMKNFLRQNIINKRRQSLPVFYTLNGAIYLIYYKNLLKDKAFFGDKTYAYKMPPERSFDIDTEIDFKFAEFFKNKVIK